MQDEPMTQRAKVAAKAGKDARYIRHCMSERSFWKPGIQPLYRNIMPASKTKHSKKSVNFPINVQRGPRLLRIQCEFAMYIQVYTCEMCNYYEGMHTQGTGCSHASSTSSGVEISGSMLHTRQGCLDTFSDPKRPWGITCSTCLSAHLNFVSKQAWTACGQ